VHNEFNVKIQTYNQIVQSDVEKLVASLIKKHPKKISFDTDEDKLSGKGTMLVALVYTYYPPTDEEIKKYNIAYQKWENEIQELFTSYADKQNKYVNIFPFNITIKNNGNIPADNFLVDFEILSGGLLVSPDFNDEVLSKRLAYPTPPKPPEGTWKNKTLSALGNFANVFPALKNSYYDSISPTLSRNVNLLGRDKNRFYWKDGRPDKNTSFWRFECDEFMHKLDGEKFSFFLVFSTNSEKIAFRVRISASNMSSPLVKLFIFHKKEIFIETKNDLLNLVKNGVTEEVMKRMEGNAKDE